MKTIYLGLGSNLGRREENLQKALASLVPDITVTKISAIYETEPMYVQNQPKFLNMVCEAKTELAPMQVLHKLQMAEREGGREEYTHNKPRPIDIDLLFYGTEVVKTPELTIPHPKIPERAFVLDPMSEIAPDFVHPVLGETISQLRTRLRTV